jgi:flagellar hook-length control protein FliK
MIATTPIVAKPAAAAPSANPAPAAGGRAGGPAGDVTGDGEVLSVAELLRLLEQGEGFNQALAGAAAPGGAAGAPTGRVAGRDAADERDAADGDDANVPCDIATLLRLLERPPAPDALAAGAMAAAADALARATVSALGSDVAVDDAAATPLPRPAAAAGGATSMQLAIAAAPAGAAAASDSGSNLLEAAVARAAADAGIAGREPGRDHVLPSGAASAPAPDPVQVTLGLAQGLRAATPAAVPVERAVHVPVRDPAWPQAVAAEIQFLADQKVEAATLRLSPEHLGPLEVRIDVRDGNVSVAFGVAHADTQAALEQALPRLREMFAAAGLQLGQASVQQEARRGSHNGGRAPAASGAAADNGTGAAPAAVRALGLVDDYA